MARPTPPQNYPRIQDKDDKFNGFLDDSKLQAHSGKISADELKRIVLSAIKNANKKSSRAILNIPNQASDEEVKRLYEREGRRLFDYFRKYYGDPASTAHQCLLRPYSEIAKEQFRNRTLQKERMNSGWRYQFIAKDAASQSKRFDSISDIGTTEADFNATVKSDHPESNLLTIYVSVKNRSNTMGGQDWPKSIRAMEDIAIGDKNRTGPYLCVFGIAMERGLRIVKHNQKTGNPYSVNTEVWMSDFFWPFFANYSYEEIVRAVLEVLIETQRPDSLDFDIPQDLIDAFGIRCKEFDLLDEQGRFNNAYKLIDLFCGVSNSASRSNKRLR